MRKLKKIFSSTLPATFLAGVICSTLFYPIFSQDTQPENYRAVLNSLGLIPQSKDPSDSMNPLRMEKQIDRKLTEPEQQLLLRDAGGRWKKFSDDLLEFELPDDPLLKVEPFTPNDQPQLNIVGGAVGSTDKSFDRIYRITFSDGLPYGLIFVRNETWFDDGICFCGSVVLKTFAISNGNLLELSLLESGKVKKFQAINDTHRAILFEWTHSAITQSAYARIGTSLRLKPVSKRSEEDWIALSKDKRKFEAGLGWLRVGIPVSSIASLLGAPSEATAAQLLYMRDERLEDERGFRTRIALPIESGKLKSFEPGWIKYSELDAPYGTRAWMEDTLRSWSDKQDDLEEGKHPNLPTEDVKFMLKAFHQEAPTSTGEDWGFWCGMISDLARLGIMDEDAAALVVKRFSNNDLPQFQGRWVLELYEIPKRMEMFHRRLAFMMDVYNSDKDEKGEIHNLFGSLKPGNKRSEELIRRGVAHDDDKIRVDATYFLDKLPRVEARKLHRQLITDPSKDVRKYAIIILHDLCDKNDLEWLEEIVNKEHNEENRDLLMKRIAEID